MRLCNPSVLKLAPKHARRKEARPGELLAAALELFVEKGFAATRVEEVAQRAGVSKGTLFLYFPSKEELFKAVVRENIAGRYPEWTAEFEAYAASTPELLRRVLHQWWERVGNTPVGGIAKLMMSEAANFPELAVFYEREVMAPGRELIARILQRGVDRGEFAPLSAPEMAQTIHAMLAPMLYLVYWKHSFGALAIRQIQNIEPDIPDLDPLAYLEQQTHLLLHGLCVTPSSPSSSSRARNS